MRFSTIAAVLAALTACNPGGKDAPAPTELVVTSSTTYWELDGTKTSVPRDGETIDVLVPDGAGYAVVPMVKEADGVHRLAEAPAGRFFVRVRSAASSKVVLTEATAGKLDVGHQLLGRADAVRAAEKTPLTLELSGLYFWSDGDALDLFSPSLDEQKWLSYDLAPGSEAGTATGDVTEGVRGLQLDASRGDVALVTQTRTVSAGGLLLSQAIRMGTVSGVSTPAGQAASFAVALAPPPVTRELNMDFRPTAFAAILGGVAPDLTVIETSATAYPHPLEARGGPPPVYSYPVLAKVATEVDFGGGSLYVPLPDAGWGAYVEAGVMGVVTLPGNSAFMTLVSWVDRRADAGTPALAPPVGPARALAVGGHPLTGAAVTGVGTTPLLTWQPPALGAPTWYRVSVSELPFRGVLTATTRGTALRIPEGVLEAGKTYWVEIAAWWEPNARADRLPTLPMGATSAYGWSFTP